MKPWKTSLAATAALLLISSCLGGPPRLSTAPGAVNLVFEADAMLNTRGGEPHPVSVCVYQLREPDAFTALARTEDGIYKLLECSPFDPGVADVKRCIVQPGTVRRVSLGRAEGAGFVGLVAGYYAVDRGRSVRIFSLPGRTGGFLSGGAPDVALDVALRLGPRGIVPFPPKPRAPGTSP